MTSGVLVDLVGKRFGKLAVLSRNPQNRNKRPMWDCLCDCGNTCTKASPELKRGESWHCGCVKVRPNRIKDITGQRFGRLVALSNTGTTNSNGSYVWVFQCDCGKTFETGSGNIIHRKDCMCLECSRKEGGQRIGDLNRTHGMSGTKEFKGYLRVKGRCYDKNNLDYPEYGAKGILMDESFKDSFPNFLAEIGMCPKDGQRWSVGRIDNDLGYVKGNIRWETDDQQARNKGKQKNNTSGVTGVLWETKTHPNKVDSTLYAVAIWRGLDGKGKKKCFSTKKFGIDSAFERACELRAKMIEELNLQGAGYSDKHGL